MKKTLLLLLCLSLLLSCCACGKEKEEPLRDNSEDVDYGGSLSGEMDGGRYFERSTLKAPELGCYFIDAVELSDGRLILRAERGTESVFYALSLYSLEFTALELDISGKFLSMCAADSGELYILRCEEDGSYTVSVTDNELELKEKLTLTGLPESSSGGELAFANGQLLLLVEDIERYACAVGADGSLGNAIVSELLAGKIIKAGENTLIINQSGLNKQTTVYELDSANAVAAKYEYEAPYIFAGGRNGTLLCHDGSSIFELNYKTGEKIPYCNYKLSGCSTSTFVYIDDESFFNIQNGQPTLWKASDLEGVTVITLAAYNKYDGIEIANAVNKFNDRSADVKIVYINYADFDTDAEPLGMTHLLADILSGSCPDIFELNGLPAKLYAYKGMFEDLRPYFDASESISYDALLPSAAQCMHERGELCCIIPAFYIRTYYANGEFVHGAASWEDMFTIAAERGAYDTTGGTPESFLRDVLSYNSDKFIDYDSASCNFDSAEFIRLLEYAAQLPQDADEIISSGRAYSGNQIFCHSESGPAEVLGEMYGVFHGNYVNSGFPESGSIAKMLPCDRYAMSSASEHKEAVWAFFEYLLSNEYLNENVSIDGKVNENSFEVDGIPAVEEYIDVRLDKRIEHMQRHPDLALFTFDDYGNVDIPVNYTDENTKTQAWELLRGMDGIYEYDSAIFDIVMGEAAALFNGDKPADEVAKLIQSKASIYLSEQFD